MARVLTIRNLYDKVYSYLPLSGEWTAIGAETEDSGLWLIYGKEKNGKTTFALKLANYLSTMRKVLYVSAEENTDANIARPVSGSVSLPRIKRCISSNTSPWKN